MSPLFLKRFLSLAGLLMSLFISSLNAEAPITSLEWGIAAKSVSHLFTEDQKSFMTERMSWTERTIGRWSGPFSEGHPRWQKLVLLLRPGSEDVIKSVEAFNITIPPLHQCVNWNSMSNRCEGNYLQVFVTLVVKLLTRNFTWKFRSVFRIKRHENAPTIEKMETDILVTKMYLRPSLISSEQFFLFKKWHDSV